MQVVHILEDVRQMLTDGQGNRMDLLFRPDAGSGSLGFQYAHSKADDRVFRVQYMIAGGPAHICGQVCGHI